MQRVRLAVTLGDPRGIGPEVMPLAVSALLEEASGVSTVFVGPSELLPRDAPGEAVEGWDGSLEGAGAASLAALRRGVALCLEGRAQALVTGPVHKPALSVVGCAVPGQTELLQELAGAPSVGMLMAAERTRIGPPLRVLLATTHVPLREVAERLTSRLLTDQTRLLARGLRNGWDLPSPRIALCALNPHASDQGLFGDEEERVYGPALAGLREEGLDVDGPLSADTVFQRALAGDYDAVVAPYHDVGMAAFKTVSFGTGVNVTLGLPFVRTSPDHGTAFDRVGTGTADPGSALEAMRLAVRLAAPGTGPSEASSGGFDGPPGPG